MGLRRSAAHSRIPGFLKSKKGGKNDFVLTALEQAVTG
jgi:hypothetical protein